MDADAAFEMLVTTAGGESLGEIKDTDKPPSKELVSSCPPLTVKTWPATSTQGIRPDPGGPTNRQQGSLLKFEMPVAFWTLLGYNSASPMSRRFGTGFAGREAIFRPTFALVHFGLAPAIPLQGLDVGRE